MFFHEQVCEDVERQECTEVEKEQCSPKTVTECNDVTTEVCNTVPKEVCNLEKKIIMVEKTEEQCSGPADVPSTTTTTTTTAAPEIEAAVKPSNSYLPPPPSDVAGEKNPSPVNISLNHLFSSQSTFTLHLLLRKSHWQSSVFLVCK